MDEQNDQTVPQRPEAANKPAEGRKPAEGKKAKAAEAGDADLFLLERLYADANEVFRATVALDPKSDDVVVALDTNALLLPYQLGKGDLSGLGEVYAKLAAANRLFLPERAAREFIKHRDKKLADMAHALDERIGRMADWNVQVSPLLLEGFPDAAELKTAGDALADATRTYLAILRRLPKRMKAWRGDDPVSALYMSTFHGRTVGHGMSEADVVKELEYGLRNQVPPGYKDGGKDDRGVGDVVIWQSLLKLGTTTGKDLIFVTGEQKADWFVRAGGKAIYPRPELVDAYRHASGGRSLRLSSLAELLKEMSASSDLVADVEAAEATANTAIQAASTSNTGPFVSSTHTSVAVGKKIFDYSTYDGTTRIEEGGYSFDVTFSKASDTSIHLIRRGNARRIARVKEVDVGPTTIDRFDTTSHNYTISLGEGFLVENDVGAVLAARVLGILDDSRGADRDEVSFVYAVSAPGARVFMP